jgi:two-component system, NtrC family, sensor histidine kinase KinB
MLRTRLFLNLVPFIVILMAVGLYAIALFSRLGKSVEETVMGSYQSVMAVERMERALGRMDEGILQAIKGEKTSGKAFFEASRSVFDRDIERELDSLAVPRQDLLVRQLATNYQAFHEAATNILALDKQREQRRVYDQSLYPRLLAMNVLLEEARRRNHAAILSTSVSIEKIIQDVTRLMVMGMMVALAISTYACFQLARAILGPIRSLTRATQAVGEGNLDQLVPAVAEGELGKLAESFNQMATQLRAYRDSTTERIVRVHRTMETTLASFPDPIFVLNSEGRIELKNPAADGMAAHLQLTDELPDRLQQTARKVLESGQDYLPDHFKEVLSFRFNGREKFFLPRILAMRNKEDAPFGVAVVLYDVTRFRLLDDAKTNLVATVSHELKTPLTSVRMVLHLLLEKAVGPLTTKQEELLMTARDDAERLLRILNDLLDLARLEQGQTELHPEQVAPAELVQALADEMSEAIIGKGLKLNCSIEPNLPSVRVDRYRIRHVFTNFVTNALKHSPPGGEILLRASQDGNLSVQFSVIDQGPGVPEEFQTRIFDRFFRVPGQRQAGAGLGLSIAREIVVAHGGRIGVKSRPGRGSEFYFVLGDGESGNSAA